MLENIPTPVWATALAAILLAGPVVLISALLGGTTAVAWSVFGLFIFLVGFYIVVGRKYSSERNR